MNYVLSGAVNHIRFIFYVNLIVTLDQRQRKFISTPSASRSPRPLDPLALSIPTFLPTPPSSPLTNLIYTRPT